MTTSSDPRPMPPEKPLPTDCCGGGCAVCVFDAYEEQLAGYEARLAAWIARHPERDARETDRPDAPGSSGAG